MSSRSILSAAGSVVLCFSACRSVPTRTCLPARGSEVWVERHLRAQQPSKEGSRVDVRLLPDTSNAKVASDPEEGTLLVTRPGAPTLIVARRRVASNQPATVRLAAGTYNVALLGITFVRLSRTIDVAENDSVIVEAQLRRSAYCLEPVVVTSGR
jgi:hypothetical protein